ncbi:unnamed protein product [Thlaspi arvense]|uniref:WRKY domain-containing protein n=1 Tax=Thlaspi arvense TaxID=13288 RepID=A0AAU9T169_THLAR|nr:unnamed protein product [Thlaspi arvense]
MAGFNDNVAVMGEWLDCTPYTRKRSKAELDREVSLEDIKNKDFLQNISQEKPWCSRGGLSERLAARAGFNVPRLNTESILQSPCLTISSPGVSPATLLDSPVFLSNPLPSPTTGKLSSLPYGKAKDEFFDDIATSLAFHQSIPRRSLDSTVEPDESQDYEQTQPGGLGDSAPSGAAADDGYNWRKYGQKLVKGSEYPRSYYKCTHPNCEVRKKVERSREGHITEIIYAKAHNHPKPPPNRRSGIGSSGTGLDMQIDGAEQEGFAGTNENIEWTSPVSAELEYGSLSGSMQVQCGTQFGHGDAAADAFFKDDDEEERTSHMSVPLGYEGEVDESESKRRKLEAYATEMSGSTRASREPKVVVQTTSDIDILEDGYRWRKYGQKVVKGNPNPRSYYKCTANGCIVTKHVERASDDLASVLTTYIGKHTHEVPAARSNSHVSSGTIQGGSATQTHNHHVQYPAPRSRSEGLVTANSSLFDFQQHMRPPSGFSVYVGQSELLDLSMPSLAIGQERLPGLPGPDDIGDAAGLMLQLAAEPKVEPGSQQGLGMSTSSLIYRDIMSSHNIRTTKPVHDKLNKTVAQRFYNFTGLIFSAPYFSSMASLISFFPLPKPKAVRNSTILALQTKTIIEGLEEKFGRKGIKFSERNNVPMVELKVRNGSSLKLSLSDAHVVSYKPKVYWKDDGFEEVLYTFDSDKGIGGGVGPVIVNGEQATSVISGCNWSVKDTDSDAVDALQIELSCTAGFLDITYIISLYPVSMATALVVKNNGRKSVTLKPGIMSYMRFKKRNGAGIQGLKGCSYCPDPPLPSPFELLSPSEAMKAESPGWLGSEEGEKPGIWAVEDSVITLLENKMSRVYGAPPGERLKPVYTTPPSKYETIDQGRGLFFRIIRIGFEDIYVGCPGSMWDKYGKQSYFVCTGPASMLVPIDIGAGERWRGAMVIEHDNL